MKWNLIEKDETEVCRKYAVGRLLGKYLASAGLDEEQTAELLDPGYQLLTSKAECVLKACDRIRLAKENNEKIFVGGDYDADGVCSTAIMKATLDHLGIVNGYYIPDRFREGYGLRPETVRLAYEKGYTLIMTVDNGVKAHEAIAEAKRLGLEIIITDHHKIDEEIGADLVVHPDYMESDFEYLSGAGVALEISRNLIGNNDELTALAAVAAIGDVMPLWKQTRAIVKAGIDIMKHQKPRSLVSLLYPGAAVTERTIAFQIVPKLNSVGRMNDISNVNTVPRFLISHNEDDIIRYAQQLETVNETRKALSAKQTEAAEQMMNDETFQVIYREDFHEGVCGLVAGRLANQYRKPVLIMAKSGDLIKGSGRSAGDLDIFSFFADFEELAAFGGHEKAVGLSVREEDFESFRTHVAEKMARTEYRDEDGTETAVLISADDVTVDEIASLAAIEPIPKEIPAPYFAVKDPGGVIVSNTAKVVKYRVPNQSTGFDAVLYTRKGIPAPDDPALIIGKLSLNRWRGRVTCQMEVEDID